MKRGQRVLLSVLSGLLLSLPWAGFPGWILFPAFLPLFYLENYFVENRQIYASVSFWGHALLSALIWNGLAIWWVSYATVVGAIMSVSVNSFLMSLVLWLAHFARRKLGRTPGYIALLGFWTSFEHFQHIWDIECPWMTLGNGFSNNVGLIQWYEFTGVLGGTLWILAVNIFLLQFFVGIRGKKFRQIIMATVTIVISILVPIIVSLMIYDNYNERGNKRDIVIVQPNIDPYSESYNLTAENAKLQKFIRLAGEKANGHTDFIVGPETIVENYEDWDIDEMGNNPQYLMLKNFRGRYANAELVFGVSSSKYYRSGKDASQTARSRDGELFDVFNTAVFLQKDGGCQLYHKSILVSGVEKVPFLKYFRFMENVFVDLGGTSGNLGSQEGPSVFIASDSTKVAPVICFESVFGGYIRKYVGKGAGLIFIITNDGWWKKSPGAKQHLSFARLRAVETRRSIARAANTGISCFINQRGDIVLKAPWWQATSISMQLNVNDKITFYVRHGDYIASIMLSISALSLLSLFSGWLIKGKKNPH